MSITRFTHTDYYDASFCRHKDLNHLNRNIDSTIFSIYCAGVTIECMLRAYITKETNEFDSKHDLEKLYEKSKIALLLNDKERETLTTAIKIVNKYWTNNLRYTSEKRMKRFIAHQYSQTKFRNINKYLKKQHLNFFSATELIIKIGISKWT